MRIFLRSFQWEVVTIISIILFTAMIVLGDVSAAEKNNHSVLEDIQFLHKLHQEGALTKEEFEKIKEMILSTARYPVVDRPTATERAEKLVEQWLDEVFRFADISDRDRREIRSMVSYVADESDGVPVVRDIVIGKLGEIWIEIDEIVVRDYQLIEQDIEIRNIELHLNPELISEIYQETGVSLDEVRANLILRTTCEEGICKTSNQFDFPEFLLVKGSAIIEGERILRAVLNNPDYFDSEDALAALVASLTLHEVRYEITNQGGVEFIFRMLEEKLGLEREMLNDRASLLLYEISRLKESKRIFDIKQNNKNNKSEVEKVLLSNVDLASQAIQWLLGKPEKISIIIKPDKPMSLLSMWLVTVADDGENLKKWIDIQFDGVPAAINAKSTMKDLSQYTFGLIGDEGWIDLYINMPSQLQGKAYARGQELYALYCAQCHGSGGQGIPNLGSGLLANIDSEMHGFTELKTGMQHPNLRHDNKYLNSINDLLREGEKDALAMYIHFLQGGG